MEERLRQSHASTYHGLIESLHRALRHPQHGAALVARLRKTWRLALVDESQDSDPLQLEIFEKIFNRELESGSELQTYLLLVGDPKQAIYGFRGADLRAYQDAAARAGGAQRSTLLTNHRSAPGLLKALQALWERAPAPLGDPRLKVERVVSARSDASLPPPQGSARLELALAPAEDLEAWKRAGPRLDYAARAAAAAVRSRLGRLMGERPLGPGDCCVLVRSNREAQAVGQALRALGIPHVVRDDGDVLRCDEAVELLQVLRALLKPASRRLRRSALATRLLGLDAATLSGMDEAEDEAWRLRLAALAQTWSEQGLAACLAGLERGWPEQGLPGVLERLSLEPDAERRLTDWRHVVELLLAQPAAQSGPPEKLLHGFEAAQAAAEDFATQEQRLRRLEQDGAAVQVLTMHRAKGLEFELVFCPTLWSAYEDRNQRIPRLLRMADGRRALCDWTLLDEAQREQLQSEADWERLQEDLRLTYVALTRARRALWILVGPLGYSDNSNSVLPPSALDWLQRPLEEGEEDGPQWCRRCRRQKRVQPEDLPELGRRLERLWSAVARTEELRLQAVDLKAEPWTQSLPAAATLRMRRLDRPALPFWRLSSFSGLVRGGEDPPPRERWDPAAEEDEAAPLAPLPLPLHAFPKGRQVGDALHEILQHWDFGTPDPERLRSVLRRHGLELPLPDGGDPAVLLAQLLPTWAHVRLPGLETTLGVAARDARLSEWAFMLPLGGEGISGEGLARIFGRHARDAEEADYALRLRGLPQVALQGFLHGYIDRLLQHQNRWAVLDWKSNHLGPLPQDYEAAALWRVAAEHHYILQLHLYLLALRRHLRRRQPQAVLAGAGLAFLRGLQAGSERGILWLRPDEALLDDLEACCLEGVA
jgi:exodeoxyribonuclease V beta subunit